MAREGQGYPCYQRDMMMMISGRILDWRLRQPGFDPSFGNLACLATLKSSEGTKQICRWMTIYIYIYIYIYICSLIPVGLSSLAEEVNVLPLA